MGQRGRHREAGLENGFTALWIGQTVSLFGDYIAYLTIPLFLKELTERAFDFGLIAAAENIPTLLFGFLGGVLLDRFRLRPILIIGDLLRAAAFILLAIFSTNTGFQVWMLLPFSFLVGSLAASFNAGLQAFLWVGADLGILGKATLFDETYEIATATLASFEHVWVEVVGQAFLDFDRTQDRAAQRNGRSPASGATSVPRGLRTHAARRQKPPGPAVGRSHGGAYP